LDNYALTPFRFGSHPPVIDRSLRREKAQFGGTKIDQCSHVIARSRWQFR
jgi:hypothetical protein